MIAWTAAAIFLLANPAFRGEPGWSYEELALPGGTTLTYAVALPEAFDPAKPHPLLLAFPPGPQTRAMVEAGFRGYWGEQATRRGWVVVSPVAPDGQLFFRGAEKLVPALLREIRIRFRIEGNRMHLAGVSNGGLSAFRVATSHPFEFQSLTVLPGFPPGDEDWQRLGRLKGMVVHLFAGGADTGWAEREKRAAEALNKLGIRAELKIFPGEGHVPPSLEGDVIMNLLEGLHTGRHAETGPAAEVAAALDDFHDAAAKADAKRYFGRFAPEGVFLGTDPEERWTLAEFRKLFAPRFEGRSAWIYVPQSRQVTLQGGAFATFDEVLGNARYGVCRGTGALRKIEGEWKLIQYNLSIPIPNALAPEFVDRIRSAEKK